jgi:predicted nucleic acid-binding protein
LKLLLDSVILIDHLNGIRAATEFLAKEHLHCAISVVTRAEVLTGYGQDGLAPIQLFLEAFPALSIDQKVADLAARLRREYKWKLPDAFQAALSQTHKLKLVTRNTKDFPTERFDFVISPYAAPQTG